MQQKWLLLLLAQSDAAFYGEWYFRAAHGNTGRLYALDDYGYGSAGSWGPICQGNRREALTGQNGERFGKLACHAMGYGVESLKYIGLQDGYERYMARANSNVDCSVGGLDQSPNNEPTQCLPNYKIAGATCSNAELRSKEINKCRIRNLRSEGGSCLRGVTDVFIHCELPSTLTLGTWTEWDGADSYCDPKKDYFKQRHRKCGDADGDQSIAYWCPGPWLELVLCGECPKEIELNENYNEDYYETDKYDYADNYYRKRRSEQFDVCTCQLNTNYASDCDAAVAEAGMHTWVMLALTITLITLAIFILIYFMKKRQEKMVKYQRANQLADISRKNTVVKEKYTDHTQI